MIIFGSRAVHLQTIRLDDITCPSCNTNDSLVMIIYRKHAHVFWIPMFPIGKEGVSQCQHCKNLLEPHEMPSSIKKTYIELEKQTKGPIWQFAGAAILFLLVVWAGIAGRKNGKLEAEYISSPQIGDIYEYKIEPGHYSTLKVISISEDSVFVSPNEYEITKISKIYKINKPENYSEISFGISKDELKRMYYSRQIFDVNR